MPCLYYNHGTKVSLRVNSGIVYAGPDEVTKAVICHLKWAQCDNVMLCAIVVHAWLILTATIAKGRPSKHGASGVWDGSVMIHGTMNDIGRCLLNIIRIQTIL